MHAILNRLSTDDQCTIHFDMSRDDFLTLFTEQNINRAEVLGIRLYSGARPSPFRDIIVFDLNVFCFLK